MGQEGYKKVGFSNLVKVGIAVQGLFQLVELDRKTCVSSALFYEVPLDVCPRPAFSRSL